MLEVLSSDKSASPAETVKLTFILKCSARLVTTKNNLGRP